MNECPFCGNHLNCESDDVWICENCKEKWVRRNLLEPHISLLPDFRVLHAMLELLYMRWPIQIPEKEKKNAKSLSDEIEERVERIRAVIDAAKKEKNQDLKDSSSVLSD